MEPSPVRICELVPNKQPLSPFAVTKPELDPESADSGGGRRCQIESALRRQCQPGSGTYDEQGASNRVSEPGVQADKKTQGNSDFGRQMRQQDRGNKHEMQ